MVKETAQDVGDKVAVDGVVREKGCLVVAPTAAAKHDGLKANAATVFKQLQKGKQTQQPAQNSGKAMATASACLSAAA